MSNIVAMISEKHGLWKEIRIKRVYADFSLSMKTTCLEYGIEAIHVWSMPQKKTADIQLIMDIYRVFHNPYFTHEISDYIIVSGDMDYHSICLELKSYGKRIIGVSCFIDSTAKYLKSFCSDFFIVHEETTEPPPIKKKNKIKKNGERKQGGIKKSVTIEHKKKKPKSIQLS